MGSGDGLASATARRIATAPAVRNLFKRISVSCTAKNRNDDCASRLMRLRLLLPILAFADEAHGGCMCNVQLLGLNPYAQLFAEHHAQESKQSNDGRGGALYPNKTVDNTYTETDYQRYEHHFHPDSSWSASLKVRSNRSPTPIDQTRPARGGASPLR